MRNTATPLLIVAAALPMSGCLMDQNARLTLGQDVLLEAFEPDPLAATDVEGSAVAAPDAPPAADPEAPPSGIVMLAPVPPPSVVALNREDWDRTVLLVPVDQTYHAPTYAIRLDHLPRSERAPYAYPTPIEAATVPEGGIKGQVVETLVTPALAVGNAALIVPWAFFQPPWSVQTSPRIEYERYWRDPLEVPFELVPSDEPLAPPVMAEPAPADGQP